MVTNKIRPYKSNADHRRESCNAVEIAQMSVLYVEARGFHRPETRLDLPTFFIRRNSEFGLVEADEDLQLRNTVRVLDAASGQIDILSLDKEQLRIKLLLSDLEVVEQPPGTTWGGLLGILNPEVLPDTDVVADSHIVEEPDPFLSDELTVGNKGVDALIPEESYETQHDVPPFLPIGIAPFVKKFENQGERDAFVRNPEHKDIDVDFTELPVGPVHRQYQTGLFRKQGKYDSGNDIKVEGELCKEPLDTSEIGVPVPTVGHGRGEFVKADSLHHAERVKHEGHQLYSCQIHCFTKMLLHNWEDLVNFDQVLGISSFHGEKRSNFSFKLLNFRDFCKYNHLKIKCLTA